MARKVKEPSREILFNRLDVSANNIDGDVFINIDFEGTIMTDGSESAVMSHSKLYKKDSNIAIDQSIGNSIKEFLTELKINIGIQNLTNVPTKKKRKRRKTTSSKK